MVLGASVLWIRESMLQGVLDGVLRIARRFAQPCDFNSLKEGGVAESFLGLRGVVGACRCGSTLRRFVWIRRQ